MARGSKEWRVACAIAALAVAAAGCFFSDGAGAGDQGRELGSDGNPYPGRPSANGKTTPAPADTTPAPDQAGSPAPSARSTTPAPTPTPTPTPTPKYSLPPWAYGATVSANIADAKAPRPTDPPLSRSGPTPAPPPGPAATPLLWLSPAPDGSAGPVTLPAKTPFLPGTYPTPADGRPI